RHNRLPTEHIDIARSYHILGMAHNYIRKFDQSLEYFNKALAIRIKLLGENDTRIASSYSEIGRVHLARKDYPAALVSFEKSNAIMVQLDMTQEWDYVYVCKDMAMVNQKLGRPEIALEWQEKCLALWHKSYKKPNSSLASLKAGKGSILINLHELDAAEKEYREALTIWESLLPADDGIMGISEAGLGNVYRNAYVSTGQPSYLDKSRTYFRRFSNRMNKTLQNNNWTDTRRKELFDAIPIIERAIQADLLAYEQNPAQAEALESAWQYSESMHGYLLYAASQESRARHFADIPDVEQARDSTLRSEIFQLEKTRQNMLENQGFSLTDSLVIREDTRIFSKKQERTALLNDFEQRYPEYYRLKYDRKTASMADMQARLKPGQTLLEYFTGDSMIFVFVIQPGLSKVVQIKRDFPLNQWTLALREGITGYHTAPEKNSRLYQQTVSQYAEYAHRLYLKLLEPLRPWLTDEIIIIPDENLASIPFEALLQTTPRDLSNFVTYPFFLRTHQVQYAYSATMLRDMEERQHQTQPRDAMLAMAPFFDADTNTLALRLNRELLRIGLSPLPNSGEEVLRAVKRYHGGGDVLLGKDATRQAFWEMASRYRILHLATHGKANPQIGEFSFLAFSPTNGTNESSVCPVGELYQLSLNADLVLLSACETGIGETQKGEGVMSLARAFAFMGAKSIVASLWSVNDRSTMLIMDQFYKESANGKPKHQALALAKRQYLNDNPGLNNHPFFWAAFVGIGDMSSINGK
ncbi:MAG: CHAT domain-containing protein, partial [Saprospiraceae bacterium]|nr:CHAT domain-containing protein [Saprospiraceae bacterium]